VTHSHPASLPRLTEPQPGDRTPAPGDLALVQAFVNTRWDLDNELEEQLKTPSDLARWLAGRRLIAPRTKLSASDLDRALAVREGLRALLFVNNGAKPDAYAAERLKRALAPVELGVRFDAGGTPELAPTGRGLDAAFGGLAKLIAVAQIEGTWRRLKACPGAHCGWAFYDHSRNQSGSWCSMSTCGSRSKAREYRRRHRR
jgi:predicted RNA-binding Zn ribbon-like protein